MTSSAVDRHTPPLHEEVTDDLIAQIRDDGYGVLLNAITPQEVQQLREDAARLCTGELAEIAGAPEAPDGETVDELMRRFLCIHYPHKVSEAAMRALRAPRVVEVLTRVIGPNVKAMQSMLFIKSEGKPGQPWHQDEYFIPTRDRSLTAAWIALDDATIENGCLWVLPGSHQPGVLYPDREQHDERFDCSIEAYDFPYRDADAVPVEVPTGAAVIFNGYLLHRSLQNSGQHGYRRALANHYMSAESLLPWRDLPDDVHVGKHDFRDIVMIAGTDPYAYKGTVNVSTPLSRPDKDGGCDR
jgi:phytanoyl-CoA hydroxylase